MTTEARDPEVFAHLAGDEAAVVAYWSLWHPPGPARTQRVLATPLIGSDTIDAVLDEVAGHSGLGVAAAAGVAANPNVDPSHGEELIRSEDPGIALAAAGNPTLFAAAAQLRRARRLIPHVSGRLLLNPAADREHLEQFWEDSPTYAAQHRNLPDLLIGRFLALHRERRRFSGTPHTYAYVYANPNIDDAVRREGLCGGDWVVRVCALRNPNTSTAELHAAAEVAASGGEARLARRILARRAYGDDPMHAQVSTIAEVGAQVRVELTFAAAALDPLEREAAAALIAAGFDGTFAELCDVAEAIAHSPSNIAARCGQPQRG